MPRGAFIALAALVGIITLLFCTSIVFAEEPEFNLAECSEGDGVTICKIAPPVCEPSALYSDDWTTFEQVKGLRSPSYTAEGTSEALGLGRLQVYTNAEETKSIAYFNAYSTAQVCAVSVGIRTTPTKSS